MDFRAPLGLHGAHRQTVLGSRARRPLVRMRSAEFRAASSARLLHVAQGVRLQAWINPQPEPAPAVILIHGWLGGAESPYVVSAAQALWEAGFATARLNLRDHGDTCALNESLFHSARLEEARDACAQLLAGAPAAGLVGFSLGGNFALRISAALGCEALAVCPVIDPARTADALERGPYLYRWWFVRRWQRLMRAKAQAFPALYDFREAYRLRSLGALTDFFVARYTEFADSRSYYEAYRIGPEALRGAPVRVIAALDDPVIPVASVLELRGATEVTLTPTGGHCAFLDSWAMSSWLDREVVAHFRVRLGAGRQRPPA